MSPAGPPQLCLSPSAWDFAGFLYYDTKKSPPQSQNHGSSHTSGSRLGIPAAPPAQAEPRAHLRASAVPTALKSPVSEEFLQLPGNGQRQHLVGGEEGAQGFAAQVLE